MPLIVADAFRKAYFLQYVSQTITKNMNIAEQTTMMNPGSYETAFQSQSLGLPGFTDPPTFQNTMTYVLRVAELFSVANNNEMIVAIWPS